MPDQKVPLTDGAIEGIVEEGEGRYVADRSGATRVKDLE